MDELEIATQASEAFGPVAGFIIVILLGVVAFLVRELKHSEAKHDKQIHAMQAEYLKLMRTNLDTSNQTNAILAVLERKIDDGEQIKAAVISFLSKRLENSE